MKFWFLVGTQHLYGEEIFETIDDHSTEMANYWSEHLPYKVESKPCLKLADEILNVMREANNDDECAGVITWMHTFSPSKMWIKGFSELKKPLLHINTQYNRDIPWDSIDMDFMNLNQSAHGDREHGFITARMRLNHKSIAGYWQDENVLNKLNKWMRAAIGAAECNNLKIMRISDNMRNVAVTEGDKVEAQIRMGWQVDHYGVGDIISYVDNVTESEIDEQMQIYKNEYIIDTDNIESIRYQASLEIAIKKFMDERGYTAFHTNFEDLQQLKQLPGLASQDLMRQGYGFGAEGDWKVAGLTRVMKKMAEGLDGGTSFIEDYTYHFDPENPLELGSHMLEVCPTFAGEKAKIQVHPLGIGDREDPARLVFKAKAGKAILVTIVDMGDRFRMIVNDVNCVEQENEMPNLPVAGILWRPEPSLEGAAEAWMYAGGAHHSVLSYTLDADHMRDLAEMLDMEFVYINKDTEINSFREKLYINDVIYKIR